MPIDATNLHGFISGQLDQNSSISSFTPDYVGSVQLLEQAGFSPFTESSPLDSTLYQVFNRFVQKTGLDTTANKLKDDYLQENPSAQRAIDLYSALENTFASRGSGEQAAIVDFLNTRIDDFVTTRDTDENNILSQEESGLTDTLFREVDADRSGGITAEEFRGNFYNDFNQLNNVLNFFQNTTGTLLDVTA